MTGTLLRLNALKPSNNYASANLIIFVCGFCMFLFSKQRIISLNTVNQLILVMVKCGVLFEVRTEFLNNI
jgi:hypothetical protein